MCGAGGLALGYQWPAPPAGLEEEEEEVMVVVVVVVVVVDEEEQEVQEKNTSFGMISQREVEGGGLGVVEGSGRGVTGLVGSIAGTNILFIVVL